MSRRLILVVLALSTAAALVVGPSPAAAEPQCRFVLGFKTLHDMIPDIVGDCLVNEHFNPRNGDSLQETSHGLMVWRKADNWTAFTDGYRTWINGPYGLQVRLNTERFPWEPPLSACSIPSDALTFNPATIGPDGSALGSFTVENPCELPANLMIDIFTQSPTDSNVIADAPTIFVQDLPPHVSQTFSYRVLMAIPGSAPQTGFSWFTGSADRWLCVDVGATRCLKIDPWLKSTVTALRSLDEGQALLKIAADSGTRIQRDVTTAGLIASYAPATRTISLDPRLDAYSSWVRATVLSHELQHAADDAAGNLNFTPANCYLAEETAFRRQAQVWSDFWHDRLPPNLDAMHKMLNDVTLTVARDPSGFVTSLVSAYRSECNPSTSGS